MQTAGQRIRTQAGALVATVCSRHLCNLGDEAGASRRADVSQRQHAGGMRTALQAVGRGRWEPVGCSGQVEFRLFAEGLATVGEGRRRAEEWARDKGGQSPRSPFLLLQVELLLQSPWTGTVGAGHLPWWDSCLYSSLLPTGVISEQGLRDQVPPILQHHILKVALELPASKFLWLKAQVGSREFPPSVN